MNHNPALRQFEDPEESWAAAVLELRFLEGVGGIEWVRLEPYITAAEPVVFLRIEREEALRSGRPFSKEKELKSAEDALRVVNACGSMIGARILERMGRLAGSIDEEPKSRFSDEAILEVFGKLPRWDVDPADEEMAAVLHRFFWLAEHGGKASK